MLVFFGRELAMLFGAQDAAVLAFLTIISAAAAYYTIHLARRKPHPYVYLLLIDGVMLLYGGLQLVLRLFVSKLERYEVRSFESKGQAFDPRLHDAISQVPTADAPSGSVVNEVQKGYRIGEVGIQTFPREFGKGASTSPKNIVATISDMLKVYRTVFSSGYELPKDRTRS